MTAAIETNGDTTVLARSPFHFHDLVGGYVVGNRILSLTAGKEPDSCWGGYGSHDSYGIRTLDTNGVVLDSISLLGLFDDTRIRFTSARYDAYGITAAGYKDSSLLKLTLARFTFDGRLRWLKVLPVSMTSPPMRFWPDAQGGYYLSYAGRFGVNSLARVDSAGNLQQRQDFLPIQPASLLGSQTTGVMADGGVSYSYTNGHYVNDTAYLFRQDRFGNRLWGLKFRGEVHTHVPLADNTVLAFRTLIWDSVRASTGTIVPVRQPEVIRLDTAGQIVWRQNLVSRAERREIGSVLEPQVMPNGDIFFSFGSSLRSGDNPKTIYGRISGVQRFDPSATLRTAVGRLSAYPNPAVDQIRLEGLTRPTPISISSATGQVVLQRLHRPEEAINLSTLPAGLYFLSTEDGRKLRFVVGR